MSGEEFLYSAGSSEVAHFDRDPASGALTYGGCITGDTATGPAGSGACDAIPTATDHGRRSGLDRLGSIGIINRSLYLAASGDDSLARFRAEFKTGDLRYRGCITGDATVGPSGVGACDAIRHATRRGRGSGLDALDSVAPPGGKFVYAGAVRDNSVARFLRRRELGEPRAVTYVGCITGDKRTGPSGSGACAAANAKNGEDSGLAGIESVAAAGSSIYAAASGSQAVTQLALAAQTRIVERKTEGRKAVFRFSAGTWSYFQCKLTGKRVKRRLRHWRHCGSEVVRHKGRERYRGLRPGRKTSKVRATDRAETTDPTPAKRRWRVR